MTESSTRNNWWNQQASSPLWWPARLTGQMFEQIDKALQGGQGQQSASQGAKGFHIASEQRQALSFGKGDVSKMLASVDELFKQSPAAAVALADFVAQQDSPYSIDARRLLYMMQSFATPSAATLAAISQDTDLRGLSLEEQATARLLLAEVQYLRYAHGDPAINVTALVHNLETLAEGLAANLSLNRQAAARIMLGSLLLHRSQHKAADQQVARALALMSYLPYGCQELLELAQEIQPDILDLTVPAAAQQSKQLTSARS